MPNRLIRDGYKSSAHVRALKTWRAEAFFIRVFLSVDDYGRIEADPEQLKHLVFPGRRDVRSTDIPLLIAECEQAGLLAAYTQGRKRFIQLFRFRQPRRARFSRCPAPPVQLYPPDLVHEHDPTGSPDSGALWDEEGAAVDNFALHSTCVPNANANANAAAQQQQRLAPPAVEPNVKLGAALFDNGTDGNGAAPSSKKRQRKTAEQKAIESRQDEAWREIENGLVEAGIDRRTAHCRICVRGKQIMTHANIQVPGEFIAVCAIAMALYVQAKPNLTDPPSYVCKAIAEATIDKHEPPDPFMNAARDILTVLRGRIPERRPAPAPDPERAARAQNLIAELFPRVETESVNRGGTHGQK